MLNGLRLSRESAPFCRQIPPLLCRRKSDRLEDRQNSGRQSSRTSDFPGRFRAVSRFILGRRLFRIVLSEYVHSAIVKEKARWLPSAVCDLTQSCSRDFREVFFLI